MIKDDDLIELEILYINPRLNKKFELRGIEALKEMKKTYSSDRYNNRYGFETHKINGKKPNKRQLDYIAQIVNAKEPNKKSLEDIEQYLKLEKYWKDKKLEGRKGGNEKIEGMECMHYCKISDYEKVDEIFNKMRISEESFCGAEDIENKIKKLTYKDEKGKKCYVLRDDAKRQFFFFLKDFNGKSAKNFLKQFESNKEKLKEKSMEKKKKKIKI